MWESGFARLATLTKHLMMSSYSTMIRYRSMRAMLDLLINSLQWYASTRDTLGSSTYIAQHQLAQLYTFTVPFYFLFQSAIPYSSQVIRDTLSNVLYFTKLIKWPCTFIMELDNCIPYSRKYWRSIKFGGLVVGEATIKFKSVKFKSVKFKCDLRE